MKRPDRQSVTHAWLVQVATEQVHLVRAKDLRACCAPKWVPAGTAADWVADESPDPTRICPVCQGWLAHYQSRLRTEHGLRGLRGAD